MVFWTDFEFLSMIVAWVDIALYGLLIFVTGIFTVVMIGWPQELHHLVEMEPVEYEELERFLQFGEAIQFTLTISLFLFWVFMFILSMFLLKWAKQRNVRGLKIWFGITLAIALICTPMDVVMLVEKSFSVEAVATFVVASAYCIFALWVVGSLIRLIVKREGQPVHTVEFQSL